jgi:hypothetical protein
MINNSPRKWDNIMILSADETTDTTTSHLTNPAKDAGQVIGYSHSTDETTSHSTRLPKDSNQVAGYRLSAEELLMEPLAIRLGCQKAPAKSPVMAGHPKDDSQAAGYVEPYEQPPFDKLRANG